MKRKFDTFNEYISFVHSFEESKKNPSEDLTRELADCIIPDISITKYKLLIDKNKFDLWLNNKLSQDNLSSDDINKDKKTSSLLITTDSSEKDLYKENLQRDFNFIYKDTEEDFEIRHKENTSNYRIDPVKKKNRKRKFEKLSKNKNDIFRYSK